MVMVEEALLGAIGKLIVYLWGKLQQELSLASDAEKEYESLIDWKTLIEDCLKKASSVKVIDEKFKAGTKKLREFLSDSQSAIDVFTQSAHEGNGTLTNVLNLPSRRNFARKAKDAKQKLATGLATLKTVVDALENIHQLAGDQGQSTSAAYQSSSIAYFEERYGTLVGIKWPRNRLFHLLIEDHLLSKVIFVHGAQGIGKTSLVGAVLGYPEMRKHFKYYVWIEDLRSCELAKDIKEALMEANAQIWDLTKNDDQGDQVKLKDVFARMREDTDLGNNTSRWALVLDDASRAAVFESLNVRLSETRPSVLVTTRFSGLASSSEGFLKFLGPQSACASSEPFKRRYDIHEFEHAVLSTDDSHELFCREMPKKYNCATMSKVDFESILEKCGGLPLAILAMCEHLIHLQRGHNDPQFDEWTKWSGSLQFSSLSNYEEEGHIRRMITKCVDRLHNVRDWVFYLNIFPLNCPLRCSTLIRLWMAEGFPEEMSANSDPRISEKTLSDLVDHNFFQDVKETSYGRFSTCYVNNLLHQIITSKLKKDNFAMIVAAGQEERWPYTIERLSFQSTMKREVEGMRVRRLSSLHVFEKVCLESLQKLLRQVESLKVLDLQRFFTRGEKYCYQDSLKSFPDEILRLKYLTYLSLRDTKVKDIPDGIKDLENLETLDLKGTHVSELPKGILKLKRLRHLLVYRSDRRMDEGTNPKHGAKAPSELGALESLQKLCMIELDPIKRGRRGGKNKKRSRLLEEIGELTNLQRLGISMLRSTDVKPLFSSIGKLTNLEALRLIAESGQKISLSKEDEKEVPKTLKRVHLTGCLGTSPHWILSFTRLVKLVLKKSQLNGEQLNKDPLQHLGELLYLKHLELQQAFDVSEVTFKAGSFQELRFLGLDTIDSLQSIKAEDDALPTLETLSLARCNSLKTVPQYITRPSKLKCLKLYMPEEFITAVKGLVPANLKVQPKVWKEGAIEDAHKPPTNGARRFPWPFKFK